MLSITLQVEVCFCTDEKEEDQSWRLNEEWSCKQLAWFLAMQVYLTLTVRAPPLISTADKMMKIKV
jgi:hypothetical protein